MTRMFWKRWLTTAAAVVLVFGLAFVLLAAPVQRLFETVYLSPGGAETVGPDAAAYTALMGAVLGSVMIGWAILLLFIVNGPYRRGERAGWTMIAVSLAAWFVPDTAYSLWSGFWPNAVLNLGLAAIFAVPLAATYRSFHGRPDHAG